MFKLKELKILTSKVELDSLPEGKLLINTINAHSYNIACKDAVFAEALTKGDVLIPDGISIVKACKWIDASSHPAEKIAGWDLFEFEMNKLNKIGEEQWAKEKKHPSSNHTQSPTPQPSSPQRPKVMFIGSSEKVLSLIRKRIKEDFLFLDCETYSPPFKTDFSEEDSRAMVEAINTTKPDLLWIGLTAPKQEKWTYTHWNELNIHCHVGNIGAVFDFFAGTIKRAPLWWQRNNIEWLYRLLREPRRMWRRYIIGNPVFLWNILVGEKEWIHSR